MNRLSARLMEKLAKQNVVLCLNRDVLHLANPIDGRWICGKGVCKGVDSLKLLISDLLLVLEDRIRWLRLYGKLHLVWDKLIERKDSEVKERFLEKIAESTLEGLDLPDMRAEFLGNKGKSQKINFCAHCFGSFLDALWDVEISE